MGEPRAAWVIPGSLLFLVLAPGSVAGLIPFALTGWRVGSLFLGLPLGRAAGALLVGLGLASLLESFARFALRGFGTPAPVAPPTQLVVSGQYRYVRNPMYVAILAIVLGQSLLLGRAVLLVYAGALWFVFHTWVVVYEERTLATRFGLSFQAYRAHVRRWWPRVTPWRE